MSILRFLGVVDASGLLSGQSAPAPPRQRKLALETLDSRALLTLFTPIVTDAFAELEEVALPPEGQTGTWEEQSTGSEGGNGGTTGEPNNDPPSEPTLNSSAGGSAGGEGGDPPPLSNPGSGGGSAGGEGGSSNTGSGSGGGDGGTPPEITSSIYDRSGAMVDFSGTVTDDESMFQQLVYFRTDEGQQFTATIDAEGRYYSETMMLPIGTQVSIFTIDADGHQSEWVSLVV